MKLFVFGMLIAFAATFGGYALQANAESNKDNSADIDDVKESDIHKKSSDKKLVTITRSGKVQIIGAEIVSVNASTTADVDNLQRPVDVMIKVWGVTFKVFINNKTKAHPEKISDLLKVGNKIALVGSMTEDGTATIVAKSIRDWTVSNDKTKELSDKIQELLKKLKGICDALPAASRPAVCASA
ncbi:MAG: hypothetical protein AAB407_04100 [Patescibacteria group bacterium]